MIVPIDFSNEYHKRGIAALASRNDFWENDLKMLMSMPFEMEEILLMANAKIPRFNPNDKGYLYLKQTPEGKEIVAFMIFDDAGHPAASIINFLLVDEMHRGRGIGNELVSHYLAQHLELGFLASIVKDTEVTSFWERRGYFKDPFVESTIPNHVRLMGSIESMVKRARALTPRETLLKEENSKPSHKETDTQLVVMP